MASIIERLLRIPIFYKVLLANSAIVMLGAAAGTYMTIRAVREDPTGAHYDVIALFVLGGLVVSLILNVVALRFALLPMRILASVVDSVSGGDFSARAGRVRITDDQIDRVIATLNAMLENVQRYREQVHNLSTQVLSAQEEERKRIARELHDETAQALTSVLVRLRVAERMTKAEEMRAGIADARQLTLQTLDEVRNLAHELRPSALDDLGLIPALRSYIKQYSERNELEVDFTADPNLDRLPPAVEVVLYRVVQEALTNIVKHARAEHVTVAIEQGPHAVEATVTDDGRGFDFEATMRLRERGLGLFGMQERLALVGGVLEVESAPGKGSRLRLRAPVDQPYPVPNNDGFASNGGVAVGG